MFNSKRIFEELLSGTDEKKNYGKNMIHQVLR